MTAFWIELRRSPARWWLPMLIAMDMAMLFGRSRDWIGVWPQASAAAQVPAFYLAPAVAAAAAWAASRAHRTNTAEQLMMATRPRWQQDALQFAAILTYAITAYTTGIIVAATVTAPQAGPGFLWPSYLLLGLCLILIGAAVGYLAGRWLRSNLWPPVVAVLTVLALVRLQSGPEDALYVLSGRPQLEITAQALATRFLFAAALIMLAVLAPARGEISGPARGAGRRTWIAIATAIALPVVCGTLLLNAGPLRIERAAPSRPLCTDTQPQICLWPEQIKYLPMATDIAGNVAAFPPGAVNIPSTFYERGVHRGRDADVDLQLGPWGIATGISSAILNATLPPPCSPKTTQDSERMFTAVFELDAWITRRAYGSDRPSAVGGGPGIDLAAVQETLRRPDTEQAAWVAGRLTIIKETPCE